MDARPLTLRVLTWMVRGRRYAEWERASYAVAFLARTFGSPVEMDAVNPHPRPRPAPRPPTAAEIEAANRVSWKLLDRFFRG